VPAGSTANPDNILPVRGFCIAAPKPEELDEFIKFINEELAPRSVNTLILRIDYNYQYELPDLTPVYFAIKGLNVVTCPYRVPGNAVLQA
jgi:hypothetical protein